MGDQLVTTIVALTVALNALTAQLAVLTTQLNNNANNNNKNTKTLSHIYKKSSSAKHIFQTTSF
jgi:hypothetical protein